jgi:hypothetical protein
MDTARHSSDPRLTLLENAINPARSGFGCMFLTSDEYERALIKLRLAEGRYDQSVLPVLMFIGCATLMSVVALMFD